MAKKKKDITEEEVANVDAGSLHVMPKAYRGGKLPSGGRLSDGKEKGKKEVKPEEKPEPPKVAPAPVRKPVQGQKPAPKKNTKKLPIIIGAIVLALLVGIVLVFLLTSRSEPIPEPPVTTTPTIVVPTVEPPTTTPPDETIPPDETGGGTETPFEDKPRPGRDTDSDGLSDAEERLFNSNARLPDTDEDGFLDGNEVFHLYDPSKLAPTTLEDSGFLAPVSSSSYTIFAPTAWRAEVDQNSGEIRLIVPTGERITFTPIARPGDFESFDAWAREQEEDLEISVSKSGNPIATDADQMTIYLDIGRVLIEGTYEVSGRPLVDYLQTFQMMSHTLEPLNL